ncbi:MAG: hypothetical protein GYB66_01220 [Chloroflexi bacterium]|nr:hypothetical protein [Chloroflexota bacterium]
MISVLTSNGRRRLILLGILGLALFWRGWLLLNESVNFNSDEAIIGLMARHMLQGKPVPTFFYTQDYMGSLGAMLVALAFMVFGERVMTIRVVQATLFLLNIVVMYALALEVTRRRRVAQMTALLVAVPTLLTLLYTSLVLGGYNEILLLTNVAFLLGWRVTVKRSLRLWHWGLLGFVLGLGWWTHGTIIIAMLVVGVMGLRYFKPELWKHYALAGLMFFLGSGPWWLYNLHHDWAALEFLLDEDSLKTEYAAENEADCCTVAESGALAALAISALYGFRFPNEASFQTGILAVGAAAVYLVLITDLLGDLYARVAYRKPWPAARRFLPWILLVGGILGGVIALSAFKDTTGRYLLPLIAPYTIGIALGIDRLRRIHRQWAGLALVILVSFQLNSVWQPAVSSDGINYPFDRYDDELIAFLDAHDYRFGYAHYWTSFRLSFVTQEHLRFDTALPYDENGHRPGLNRYPPYTADVRSADRVFWLNQDFPLLDNIIQWHLDRHPVTYRIKRIGDYTVYYDFSERVSPADFNLDSTRPFEERSFYDEVCIEC